MENRHLLNIMFCPLLNSTIAVCDKALSALYTVSQSVIADVRMVLEKMCNQPDMDDRSVLRKGVEGYTKTLAHPMNRYSDDIRKKIEMHLDMVLRADPGASDGVNTCRVYSTEINTQDKLRKELARNLEEDEHVDVHLSASTLQRMIQDYLKARNSRISFLQSDHNACPTCKTMKYALLQFSFEVKSLQWKRQKITLQSGTHSTFDQEQLKLLDEEIVTKKYQETTTLREFRKHNLRDAAIRGFLKKVSDHLRRIENAYRQFEDQGEVVWRGRYDHGIVTHQDDMTKIDLPHFIETASSDITRWRYDVNAHVSAITDDCIIFSHEQGGGPKTASTIMEMILLDHILRCRGEALKIVVSDNASVGKNWLTTVALPQYLVDQGLADVVLMVFLENNHGKWLADMLFGQLQTRKRRSTITGIDALLREFEQINRSGSVQGFSMNPLSAVDFSIVLESLGYQTKPPKAVSFTKRNIHFAAACSPGGKARLPILLRGLMGDLLPTEPGMVRLCSDPPNGKVNHERPYESRYLDVPAANSDAISSTTNSDLPCSFVPDSSMSLEHVPLVVPLDQPYAKSGHGVVSNRNMEHVGYNGIEFRKLAACPELRNDNSRIVQEAWPFALLQAINRSDEDAESGNLVVPENLKCAPENWVVRRPVYRFKSRTGGIAARYPPRNMLNAKYRRRPRDARVSRDDQWIPTATYPEPLFPLIPRTCAYSALCDLSKNTGSIEDTVNVLDVLRAVYERMGDRQCTEDPWLQRGVTIPREEAVRSYKNELEIYLKREEGHPTPPLTVFAAFKNDPLVKKQLEAVESGRQGGETEAKRRKRLLRELYEDAAARPDGLNKYECAVSKDLERYSKELKHFKEVVQRQFDEQSGIPTNFTDEEDEK